MDTQLQISFVRCCFEKCILGLCYQLLLASLSCPLTCINSSKDLVVRFSRKARTLELLYGSLHGTEHIYSHNFGWVTLGWQRTGNNMVSRTVADVSVELARR
ncbi:hypothetical protein ASPFODRAFT_53275 [Aspergillus luchuensis CBS 106.47]|uniref:Uncharacterized protein n=1 Tax=Aspergillus luchuensis (strain CBS 106.47) TaxID=1137211 RepID=A0A1M3T135_ASPLC|nr:hypothetical protein ASPFODRAFT_53275 [Aspergillus luchuensis CBS 106.47]